MRQIATTLGAAKDPVAAIFTPLDIDSFDDVPIPIAVDPDDTPDDTTLLGLLKLVSPLSGGRDQIPSEYWQDVFVCFLELAERCVKRVTRFHPLSTSEKVHPYKQQFYAHAITLYWELFNYYRVFFLDPNFPVRRATEIVNAMVYPSSSCSILPRTNPLQFALCVIYDTNLGRVYAVDLERRRAQFLKPLEASEMCFNFNQGRAVLSGSGAEFACLRAFQIFFQDSYSELCKSLADILLRRLDDSSFGWIFFNALSVAPEYREMYYSDLPKQIRLLQEACQSSSADFQVKFEDLLLRQWRSAILPILSAAAEYNLPFDMAVLVIAQLISPAYSIEVRTALADQALRKAVPVAAMLRFYQHQGGADLARLRAISDRAALIEQLRTNQDDPVAQATCARFLL